MLCCPKMRLNRSPLLPPPFTPRGSTLIDFPHRLVFLHMTPPLGLVLLTGVFYRLWSWVWFFSLPFFLGSGLFFFSLCRFPPKTHFLRVSQTFTFASFTFLFFPPDFCPQACMPLPFGPWDNASPGFLGEVAEFEFGNNPFVSSLPACLQRPLITSKLLLGRVFPQPAAFSTDKTFSSMGVPNLSQGDAYFPPPFPTLH